jgi:hypothetical protein
LSEIRQAELICLDLKTAWIFSAWPFIEILIPEQSYAIYLLLRVANSARMVLILNDVDFTNKLPTPKPNFSTTNQP